MNGNKRKLARTWRHLSKLWREKMVEYSRGYTLHGVIIAISVVVIVLMYPREKSYEFADLKEGEI